MLDKNGIEIKTGDIVEITGAYFKNDNGLYYVEHSAKRNICFWPIGIFTNSYETRITAKAWNKEHATIEVKTGIDRTEVAEHFKAEAEKLVEQIKYYTWNYGETCETTLKTKEIKAHYENVASMILAEA